MSQSHLKCTCQSFRQTQTYREDPGLIEKLKERQMELEEKLLDFEHKKGNLERENLMFEENIKLELQGLKENQVIQQQLTEELRDNKILTYKKQNELHLLVQNVHENEAEKKQLMNEMEFLKQSLLHTNENQQQLAKKEEHIKLLLNRISELEQGITQLKGKFFQNHFLYQGFNIQLTDLPHFKTQFNLRSKESLNLTWRHKQDNKKFVFIANNQSTNTIIKSQSKDQQQIQYQFHLINRSNRYSLLFALKYNDEKNLLTKHTFTPQIQISQNLETNSNVDFGFKYHYMNKKKMLIFDLTQFLLFQIGQNLNTVWQAILCIHTNYRLDCLICKYKAMNMYSLALYNVNNKKYDVSAYFQINEIENRLNNKMKFLMGVSTEREILGTIDFMTKVGKLGYCLKWQHVRGVSMGYKVEI